jgi:hypothetical protein
MSAAVDVQRGSPPPVRLVNACRRHVPILAAACACSRHLNSSINNTPSRTPIKSDLHLTVCASCVLVSGQELNYGPSSRTDCCARSEHLASPRLSWARSAHGGSQVPQPDHFTVRFAKRINFLNLRHQQRDNGRLSRAAVPSPNHLFGQWLSTVVKARVRARTFRDYEMRPRSGIWKPRRTSSLR